MIRLAIIIPCFQNEGSIPALCERLLQLRERLHNLVSVKFVFVNDGSTDRTLDGLLSFQQKHPIDIKVINLTRNFGSYNALLIGMEHAEADCHVHLHADLQDPPELIDEMFQYWLVGEKLVIAYRNQREDGSLFSSLYHLLVKHFAISNIPPGGFDLVLFDEQIRAEIVQISEKNTNIVYLITWLGYPYKAIPYERKKRESGVSQWHFSKKVRLFFDTIFSFTDLPRKIVYLLASLSLIIAFLTITSAFIIHIDKPLSFNTWLIVLLSFAISLLSIIGAILSEYLVRIHETVRKRPNTVIEKIY
jgi:dolichol-phosphate mannosyltransferase